MPKIALVALASLVGIAACVHATGHLPSGPPPEYEDTPLPTAASTALPGDAGALPKAPGGELR